MKFTSKCEKRIKLLCVNIDDKLKLVKHVNILCKNAPKSNRCPLYI